MPAGGRLLHRLLCREPDGGTGCSFGRELCALLDERIRQDPGLGGEDREIPRHRGARSGGRTAGGGDGPQFRSGCRAHRKSVSSPTSTSGSRTNRTERPDRALSWPHPPPPRPEQGALRLRLGADLYTDSWPAGGGGAARSGLLDKTIVVVMADHREGQESMERLRPRNRNHLSRGGTRVQWRSTCRANVGRAPARRAEVFCLTDLMPTLLDLFHLPPPATMQGRTRRGRRRHAPPALPVVGQHHHHRLVQQPRARSSSTTPPARLSA